MVWDKVGIGRWREFMKKIDKMCLKNFLKIVFKMNFFCGKVGNLLLCVIECIFEKYVY